MAIEWPGPVKDGSGLYDYEDGKPNGGMGDTANRWPGVTESPRIEQAQPGPESPKETGYKEGQYGGGWGD